MNLQLHNPDDLPVEDPVDQYACLLLARADIKLSSDAAKVFRYLLKRTGSRGGAITVDDRTELSRGAGVKEDSYRWSVKHKLQPAGLASVSPRLKRQGRYTIEVLPVVRIDPQQSLAFGGVETPENFSGVDEPLRRSSPESVATPVCTQTSVVRHVDCIAGARPNPRKKDLSTNPSSSTGSAASRHDGTRSGPVSFDVAGGESIQRTIDRLLDPSLDQRRIERFANELLSYFNDPQLMRDVVEHIAAQAVGELHADGREPFNVRFVWQKAKLAKKTGKVPRKVFIAVCRDAIKANGGEWPQFGKSARDSPIRDLPF